MVDSTYLRDIEILFLLCMLVYGTLDLLIFQLAISHGEILYRVTKLRLYNYTICTCNVHTRPITVLNEVHHRFAHS